MLRIVYIGVLYSRR